MAKTKTKATAKKTPTRPAAKSKPATKRAAKATTRPAAKAKPATKAAVKPKSKPVAKPTPKVVTVKSAPPRAVVMKSAVKGSPAKATTKIIKAGSSMTPVARTPEPKSLRKPEGKSANGKAAKAPPVSTIIPPPAPPRSGKPGKNQAGLSMKELETFRDMLLQKRRELVGDMRSMESEALQRSGENLSNLPMHMADMGTDNYEQEFTLGLMEKDRQLLREINQALSKIMDGRYGICEGTGKVISKARLEVQPWAKYSIEHARKLENRGVR